MKAFKYFDLNDNGTVEPEEFAKAIEKIGIQIPTKQVSYNFHQFRQKLLKFLWINICEYLSSSCRNSISRLFDKILIFIILEYKCDLTNV